MMMRYYHTCPFFISFIIFFQSYKTCPIRNLYKIIYFFDRITNC